MHLVVVVELSVAAAVVDLVAADAAAELSGAAVVAVLVSAAPLVPSSVGMSCLCSPNIVAT